VAGALRSPVSAHGVAAGRWSPHRGAAVVVCSRLLVVSQAPVDPRGRACRGCPRPGAVMSRTGVVPAWRA